MKVYSTNTKEKKNKKSLLLLSLGVLLIVSAIVIALVVTLPEPTVDVSGNIIPPNAEQSEKYVMPLSEYSMGQDFSDKLVYNQTLKQWRTHNGVDFVAQKGAEVRAILGGKVTGVENTTLEGTVVTIEQNDGVVAVYKSLAVEVNVEEGAVVNAGDVIGKVDETMATEKMEGAHLHLEMKKDGQYLDPLEYLPNGSDK